MFTASSIYKIPILANPVTSFLDHVLTSVQKPCLRVGNYHPETKTQHKVCKDQVDFVIWANNHVEPCLERSCPRSEWDDIERGKALYRSLVVTAMLTRYRNTSLVQKFMWLIVYQLPRADRDQLVPLDSMTTHDCMVSLKRL